MRKKSIIVFLVSAFAFGRIMSIVSSYVASSDYWKLLIPATVLFGLNVGTILAVIALMEERKGKKADADKKDAATKPENED